MISQPDGQYRRPSGSPLPASRKPLVRKQTEDHQRIPSSSHERIQPIAQHAIQPMHRIPPPHPEPDAPPRGPSLTACVKGVSTKGGRHPLSRRLRIPTDLTNRPSMDRPSITDPGHAPMPDVRWRACATTFGATSSSAAPRHHKTSRPVKTRVHLALRGVWIDKRPENIHLDLAPWTRTSVAC